jgi:hypothetical protein
MMSRRANGKSFNRSDVCRRAAPFRLVVLVILCFVSVGCSGGDGRLPVSGLVSLDGQPLAKGQINFLPSSGTDSPASGAIVENGHYSIPEDKGLMAGKFRVEVSAMGRTSRKTETLNVATGKMEAVEALESIIPARYNRDTELTAEVKAGAANEFNFELTSQ